MPFAPDIAIDLSTPVPKAPAAITATVLADPAESPIEQLSVQFPKAFGYNETAGSIRRCLRADEDAQTCPESSKIGTTTAKSPIADAAGDVFLTDDFRLIMFAKALGGLINIKVTADIEITPEGGFGLTFTGFPQLPLSEIKLNLVAGERALLKNPAACGTYRVPTQFDAFDGTRSEAVAEVPITGCTPVDARVRAVRARVGERRVRLRWETAAPQTLVRLERRRAGAWRAVGIRRVSSTQTRFGTLKPGRYRVRLRGLGGSRSAFVTRAFRVTP